MPFCEDYPCCGHTDGLGCDYRPDYEYINKHAACDHEVNECVLYGGYDDDVDPEDCEHGDATQRPEGWMCDLCGSDLVMVTDTHERCITSRAVPGLRYSIPVVGWHFEIKES